MVFALIPLLLAQVVCVDNGDGSWTCSGSGIPGVTTNAQGQATCTNCVNMTPQKCHDIKESLTTQANQLYSDVTTMRTEVYDLITYTEDQKVQFQGFTDFPYSYVGPTYSSTVYISALSSITGNSSNTSSNRQAAAHILVNGYNNSVNSDFAGDYSMPSAFSANDVWATYQGVYGFWHGSYEVSQSVVPIFSKQINDLNSIRSLSDSILTSTESILGSVDEITCAPCLMSSGDGSSSGVQTGCLECYLIFLRRYQEQFDFLNSQVQALTNIQVSILNQVQNMASYFPSFSNNLQRIDDYLWTDQSNMLANVEAAIIVISNNVDTIQQYYFHTFSNASDISMGVYGGDAHGNEFNMEVAFNRIFKPRDQGGFQLSEYERYDWFRRIELQLSQISGIFSETNVDSISDSEYESMKNKVDEFEDLSDSASSAGASVISVGEAVKNAVRSVGNIFPSSAPPGEIKLLDKQYWFADTDLVLRTDYQVVSFCRALFGLIWTVLAVVGFWILLSRSWVVLFDIARWFCNWFPKIFGN